VEEAMSDLKTDLLRVIQMAEESTGDRNEVMGWLTRVKARVQSGSAHDDIRRKNRVLKNALEEIGETVAKALLALDESEGQLLADRGDEEEHE
jgi:hypothetical protein